MKKIYDIIPQKAQDSEKEGKLDGQAQVKRKKQFSRQRKIRYFIAAISVSCVLILTALFLFLTFNSSLILTLQVKTEELSLETDILANQKALDISFENNVLPAVFLSEESSLSDVFQATGKQLVGEKARGKIIIYNKKEPAQDLTLIAQTRFLSAEGGKIFRIGKKITVPKAQMNGGKLEPGSIEVEVVAEEPGEDYNINSSNFSVPGLSGTIWYYNVWAESKSPMLGGSKIEKTQVSKSDLDNARSILEQKMRKIAQDALKNESGSDLVIDNSMFLTVDYGVNCSKKAGELADSFQCQGNLIIEGLAFKKSDLKELGLVCLGNKIPFGYEVLEDSFTFSLKAQSIVLNEGKTSLSAVFKTGIYEPLEQEVFLIDVVGKPENIIKDILKNKYSSWEIVSFELKPFWLKKAPKNIEDINLELVLSE